MAYANNSGVPPNPGGWTAWIYFEWLPFLESCERKADPAAFAARKESERKAAIQRGIDQMDRDFAEREQEIRKAQAQAAKAQAAAQRARLKAAKIKRTTTVKRIMDALPCGTTRAYVIHDNGTENPAQQHRLAAAFANDPKRCTHAAWAYKGTSRYDRSLKTFLLSQAAEFEAGIGPDLERLRLKLVDVSLSHIRAPRALAAYLSMIGGNTANAYPIWMAFQQWRDARIPVVPDDRKTTDDRKNDSL